MFPFPPIENYWKWLYQLLPFQYELKLPSEVMLGLLVIQIQIQAMCSDNCQSEPLMWCTLEKFDIKGPVPWFLSSYQIARCSLMFELFFFQKVKLYLPFIFFKVKKVIQNQVQNRLKIQFVELDFSEIKYRSCLGANVREKAVSILAWIWILVLVVLFLCFQLRRRSPNKGVRPNPFSC